MTRIARTLRIAFLVLLVPAAASSQLNTAVIHAQAGYAFQEASRLRGGLETGFGLAYPFAQRFWVSVEFSRWKATSRGAPHILQNGTITLAPLIVCLQYEFLDNKFFVPYVFAGGAFVFASFEIGPYASIPEVKIKQTIRNGPAYDLGLGARIALSRTVSFFSEAGYLVRKGWGDSIVEDMNLGISEEAIVVNLKTVFLKFGLKFFL